MKTRLGFALATLLAAANCIAAEPPASVGSAGVRAELDGAVDAAASTQPAMQNQSLRARYPARPAVFHADGSVSQYLGATHLMQTVVRLDANGKLQTLCTTDSSVAEQFVSKPAEPAEKTASAGEKQ